MSKHTFTESILEDQREEALQHIDRPVRRASPLNAGGTPQIGTRRLAPSEDFLPQLDQLLPRNVPSEAARFATSDENRRPSLGRNHRYIAEIVVLREEADVGPEGTIVVPVPAAWVEADSRFQKIDLEFRVYRSIYDKDLEATRYEQIHADIIDTYPYERGMAYPLVPEEDSDGDFIIGCRHAAASVRMLEKVGMPGRAVISFVVVVVG